MKKKPVVTRNHTGLLLALLAVVVLIAFFPTLKNGFVNWDDPVNVYENPYVKDFTAHNIHMIFTTHVIGNYNPLPILTFAVETALFGMNPKVMHFTNLFLHILCTLLVFLLIRKLDYSERVAFLVALLFGIQPMRVESVAWITERKDVLFGLFYLASLYSYVVYIKKGKVSYLLYSLLLFIPALLSKIQAVSLPLAMLVVDYLVNRPKSIKLLVEKIPFFLLSLITGIVGIWFLGQAESLGVNDFISPLNRLFIAGWTLVVYLVKSVVPYEMSALYPYPGTGALPAWFYLAPLVLIVLVYLIYRTRKQTRVVIAGSLFFLVNVMFVLQIVGAGQGFLADRFTYIPYIGLFLVYAVGIDALLQQKKKSEVVIYVVLGVYLLTMGIITNRRCTVWENGGTLWTDVLKKYDRTPLPYNNLGRYYREMEQYDLALENYNKAIALGTADYQTYNNRGKVWVEFKEYEKALADYNIALEKKPRYAEGLSNRGSAYGFLGKYPEAIRDFTASLEIDPGSAQALKNRALTYYLTDQSQEAAADITQYLEMEPTADMYNLRGLCYRKLNKGPEALADFNTAISLDPGNGIYYQNRAFYYYSKGDKASAIADIQKAESLGVKPDQAFLDALRK